MSLIESSAKIQYEKIAEYYVVLARTLTFEGMKSPKTPSEGLSLSTHKHVHKQKTRKERKNRGKEIET